MTLDHSFLSDSRNFFVWPRVISVHSYYLTSLVTSHFCRLTIAVSFTHSFRKSYSHSIIISLSAGSSYMSVMIRRTGSPVWLVQRFSCHLMAWFPVWNTAFLFVLFLSHLALESFCFYALSLPSHVLSEKGSYGFCFGRYITACSCSPHFTLCHLTHRFCVDTGSFDYDLYCLRRFFCALSLEELPVHRYHLL